MKRFLFCCLRGGSCVVDIQNRKKCNYCRYSKCLSVGMVTRQIKSVTSENAAIDLNFESESSSCSKKFNSTEEYLSVTQNIQAQSEHSPRSDLNPEEESFKVVPVENSLSTLSSEMERIKYIKDLYKIQCEVDPISANHVIQILESTRSGETYCKDLVHFHVKVDFITLFNYLENDISL